MLINRSPDRRRLAEGMGAGITVDTPEEARAVWPRGADLVLDSAGVASTVAEAPRLADRGGRVVVVGVLAKNEMVAIEPFDLLTREVDVRMAFVNPFTQSRALQLLASGAILTRSLITSEIGREELPAILAARPGPAEVKVLVAG